MGRVKDNKYVEMMMRDITTFGGGFFTFFLAVLLFIVGKGTVAERLVLGFPLIYPITALIRLVYYKKRPKPETHTNFIEWIDSSSFPSIHAANSFYMAFVLHSAFASNPASLFLFFLAAFVGYTRIYFKKHYPVDVAGGAVLGLALSYLTVNYVVL
ncbi:MAG: phosphatase PAP2 family protein [Candidatus Aenigmatarchaeota archaeon]|nr:MAG: phosphatase PAP2 family protein [Candidatus Aenigmarchaeota archaeon]